MSIYPTTTLASTQTFLNTSNALFDPTSVKCKTRSPSGTETTYTYGSSSNLTKTATGYYKCTFDADSDGVWIVSWYGADSGGKITFTYSIEIKEIKTSAF